MRKKDEPATSISEHGIRFLGHPYPHGTGAPQYPVGTESHDVLHP